jgi:uncharacterized membrane protein YfcA
MSGGELAGTLAVGFAAGVASGMLGIGGGLLFVPGLVLILGESQLHAEATSLLAIIPVAVIGVVRQRSYGNLRLQEGLIAGALSPLGVLGGVVLANVVSDRVLSFMFAAVLLYFAYPLARRALTEPG